MKKLKFVFLSVIFWQLTFAPQVQASNEITSREFSKIITQYKEKKYNGKELIQFIKDNDQKLYRNVESYLKKNEFSQYEKIQLPQVEMIKDKEFKLILDQKEFTVMMQGNSSFKITYNKKSAILSFNHNNIDEWINATNSLNIASNSFHLSNLFIDTAEAASLALVIGVVLTLAAIYAYTSFSAADEGTLSATAERALSLCHSGLDSTDPMVQRATKTLEKSYGDKCKTNKKTCDKIKEAINCLNNIQTPTGANDTQRGDTKPQDLDPAPTPVDFGARTGIQQ